VKEGDKYMAMRKFSDSNSFFNLVCLLEAFRRNA